MRCPECNDDTPVKIKGKAPSGTLTAAEVVLLMPLNFALVRTVRGVAAAASKLATAHAPAAAAAASSSSSSSAPATQSLVSHLPLSACAFPGCRALVSSFCTDLCGKQCELHDRDGHAAAGGFSHHKRMPIGEMFQQQQASAEIYSPMTLQMQWTLASCDAQVKESQTMVDAAHAALAAVKTGQPTQHRRMHAGRSQQQPQQQQQYLLTCSFCVVS